MNLVPHGILLQVTVWLIHFQHGFRLCSGGEPGYLDFDNLPETNFSCKGKVIGGYYADVETGCQMFHVCTVGQNDERMDIKFLCLNGTVFDQETRVCERVDEVDCSKSERFYNLNLELYGNNAVTLSNYDASDDEGDPTESIDDQHSTTLRPTTTTTTTTTQRPTNPPATPTTVYHQQNNGYSQHYQTQPLYSTPQTSQSKSLYDDKNSGYHHQYIFHNGEQANNQATSFQLFSNQGVSSTTNQPQIHQARYGTTSSPQIILNGPSTVAPLFHGVSSTIQTLLNSNANNPSFINPLFHNHGIPSTTEHFTIHSNNPRETQEYHEDGEQSEDRSRRPLEALQSTNQGKISKLSISPVPTESGDDDDSDESVEEHSPSSESSKISTNFLPTPTTPQPTTRSFYPTPKSSSKLDPGSTQIIRHIHLSPPPAIPQLKPQQITIHLPPPDIQRIVQNPSPLLPSQSRVIVTAKASVSDESGRPLNTSELVVLPLPTIPASYDDYKEGDESFDPFYRDVPKIRRSRSAPQVRNLLDEEGESDASNRRKEALRRLKRAVSEDQNDYEDGEELARDYEYPASDDSVEDEDGHALFTESEEALDIATIKANFKKFKALLLGRRMSGEILSEMKTSKEHFGGSESKASYDEAKLTDDINDDDDGSQHREDKEIVQGELENITDLNGNQESHGDENSRNLNRDDNADKELISTMKTSEKEDNKYAAVVKGTETEEQVHTESPPDIQKTDSITVESDVEESYHESESLSGDEKSVDEPATSLKASEHEANIETMESSRDAKESNAEEEVKSRKTIEETIKSKSPVTTIESDAEEYIQPENVPNTKESDLEEYIESKSVPTTKETDVEESFEPKINAKESDSKEYFRPKSPEKTEELDAHKVVGDPEKPATELNTQKSLDHEVSRDTNSGEQGENTTAPILGGAIVPEITLETKSTSDAEEPTFEEKVTTETNAEKVEPEPEAKMNQSHQEADEESINTSNNEEGSVTEDSIKSEMISDQGELTEKKIMEPMVEGTNASTDVEEAEKSKPSMKAQVSKAEENDQPEGFESKDSDVEKQVEAQTEQSEVISKVSQEAEDFVMPDNMKLHQGAVDQKSEVKEKLTDHSTGKKPDSLVEKVESVVEMKDSMLEEKLETAMKPEEIRESKLSQLHSQKSKPITSSGWKPNKEKSSTSHSPATANGDSVEPPSQASKEVEAKTKLEAESGSKLPKSPFKNEVGCPEGKPKLPGEEKHTEFSKESGADGEYLNDAQLPESMEETKEKLPEKGEPLPSSDPDSSSHKIADANSAQKSSESPNKIPSDLLNCDNISEKHKQSSDEDSRSEYDDYASEEYVSGSRESEPYERSSEEIGSREPTSEYTDSSYDPTDDYSTSREDYAPVSGETYSTEDSRSMVSNEDYSTEGVLKFTDEIPEPGKKQLKQKNRMTTRAKVSSEDYVDDNYEPEHYRENSEEKNDTSGDKKVNKDAHQSSSEEKLNDEAVDDHSTTTTTTTTTRPTPPSLFRPFSIRKNYKYIPPTTTPNPVVIKHRFGLFNPRPAKPIKSYNDLAPKPVIRKSPFVTRKPYGTESTTKKLTLPQRRIDDFEDSSEIVWTSTEYIDEDEKPRDNKLTRSANEVSFNETNETLGSDEDNLPKDSTIQNNNGTNLDSNSGTERTSSTTSAYLSTPYPLLKATTSGNLIVEEAEERKLEVRNDEPTTETPKTTQVEGSSEFSTSSSSTTEGTAPSFTADEKPLKLDEDHQEERPKISKVPFSCIDKEPYRFYGDPRDCRLFHYCSPGFTARQMLDFRFVCEDTTIFDEESQSCRHDLENSKCANRKW